MFASSMLLMVVACLAALPSLVADDKASQTTTKGQIFSVNEREIVVMADKSNHTFDIVATTKISLEKTPVKAQDLKPTQFVTVVSKEEGDRKVALSIEAKGLTGKPMPPAPKAE